MIITAIITFMIQDISLQEIAFNYQRYHKTEQEEKKLERAAALNANYTVLSLALL